MIKIHRTQYQKKEIKEWLQENFEKSEYSIVTHSYEPFIDKLYFANDTNETFFNLKFGNVTEYISSYEFTLNMFFSGIKNT